MAERRSSIKWDDRYDKRSEELHGISWSELSKQVRLTTKNKCVLCDRTSTSTHHTCYFGPYKAGVDLFGLCDQCHNEAHLSKNWRRYKYQGLWRNKNTTSFYKRLRKGWLDKHDNRLHRVQPSNSRKPKAEGQAVPGRRF